MTELLVTELLVGELLVGELLVGELLVGELLVAELLVGVAFFAGPRADRDLVLVLPGVVALVARLLVAVFLAAVPLAALLLVAARRVVDGSAVLVAFLAGAAPLPDFAADRFAGVLAVDLAVRFAGASVAGLALVAATSTPSVGLTFGLPGHAQPRVSDMSNVGVGISWDSCRYRSGGRRRPL